MRVTPIVLIAAIATLGACGSRPTENQAGASNAMPGAPVTNEAGAMNGAASVNENSLVGQERPAPSAQAPAPDQPRTRPAQKAEPAARPAEPVDPHAGHDMSNMTHNQSTSRP